MSIATPRPQIVAHRGLHAEYPENSLAGFRAAVDAGADWVECDVHASADGEPMVIHDATLDRTTMASGVVSAFSAEVLSAIALRDHAGNAHWGHVPRLTDIEMRTGLLVEVKPPDAADLARKVVEICSDGRRWMFQSFDQRNLVHALCADINTPVALLVDDRLSLEQGIAAGWKTIHLYHDLLDESTVHRLRGRGVAIGVWTVNTESDLRRVMDLAADMIITDELLLAMRIRDEI